MLFAAVVGSAVALLAALSGVGECGGGAAGAAQECRAFVRTMSIRVGVAAGTGTVLMVFFVAGLLRMAAQNERDRREALLESYREHRHA